MPIKPCFQFKNGNLLHPQSCDEICLLALHQDAKLGTKVSNLQTPRKYMFSCFAEQIENDPCIYHFDKDLILRCLPWLWHPHDEVETIHLNFVKNYAPEICFTWEFRKQYPFNMPCYTSW
ncbi:hypothetical protein SADUNF_Sadunf03G0025500 [Salix dunnii]|uniref:Uncharacterized protein n=1 Tax=Salix dunnii TaxID=1413687 RepID=A0A835N1K9_9ROSI|nr:hypothetical protein SADUNF_Sadunf03G0025500 [Salix dunnii]